MLEAESPGTLVMINLEEEARKRRERLKSSLSEPKSEATAEKSETRKRRDRPEDQKEEGFNVPEGEALFDTTGAEILGLDTKLPDTLEAQVKSLLSLQNDLILDPEVNIHVDKNSDLKREYERRMTLLNKQTRRSTVDIVRARLEKEESAEELKE